MKKTSLSRLLWLARCPFRAATRRNSRRHAGRRRDRCRRRRADRVGAYGRQRGRRHCRRHHRRRHRRADRQRRDGAALHRIARDGAGTPTATASAALSTEHPACTRHGHLPPWRGPVGSAGSAADMTARPFPDSPLVAASSPRPTTASGAAWPAELPHPALYRHGDGRRGAEALRDPASEVSAHYLV